MPSNTVNSGEILHRPEHVAALIDHTLLKPDATESAIAQLCAEAAEFRFASVCVNPYWVRFAKEALRNSRVRVCTVIGFPLGANDARAKIAEAEFALAQGAQELDMVQNIGALLSGHRDIIREEIISLARTAHSSGAILKVILETCLLTDAQKISSCEIASQSGADFVKTSTGFSTGGATVDDVRLMRQSAAPNVAVKASGGVRTLAALREMVAAGATRIGTSSGVSIMRALSEAATATLLSSAGSTAY